MSTLYRDTSFIQILGNVEFSNANNPAEPTARTSITLADAAFISNPWQMNANGMFLIELDSTDRGGNIFAATLPLIQRTSMPNGYLFPTAAGVLWTDVPTAEMTIGAIAAENIQVLEFSGEASYVYRLSMTAATVTNAGDLWIGVTIPSRFSV